MALSSFLTNFVIPLNLGIALLVLGVLSFVLRYRRVALFFAACGLSWVLFWSLPATSLWAGGHLEQLHPYRPPDQLPNAEAIVVLGGSTANNRLNWFESLDKTNTVTRVDTAARLYHAGRAPVVIVSGAALDRKSTRLNSTPCPSRPPSDLPAAPSHTSTPTGRPTNFPLPKPSSYWAAALPTTG